MPSFNLDPRMQCTDQNFCSGTRKCMSLSIRSYHCNDDKSLWILKRHRSSRHIPKHISFLQKYRKVLPMWCTCRSAQYFPFTNSTSHAWGEGQCSDQDISTGVNCGTDATGFILSSQASYRRALRLLKAIRGICLDQAGLVAQTAHCSR